MARTLILLNHVPTGFHAERIAKLRTSLRGDALSTPAARVAHFDELKRRLEGLVDVDSVMTMVMRVPRGEVAAPLQRAEKIAWSVSPFVNVYGIGTLSDWMDVQNWRPRFAAAVLSGFVGRSKLHNAIRTARMCRVRKGRGMARLVFGMNQSLDGYVDHTAFAPSPTLFRHFIEEAQGQAGSVYGRHMYEVMRYWDDDHPEWEAPERAFAAAWRNQPKWVVSRSLTSVGPNARLVEEDLEGAIRALKAERDGEIEVAGPNVARSLTELGLIDEYRIYLHPVVVGHGKPYFAGPRPRLRLVAHDRIGEDVIRLVYVPA